MNTTKLSMEINAESEIELTLEEDKAEVASQKNFSRHSLVHSDQWALSSDNSNYRTQPSFYKSPYLEVSSPPPSKVSA